MTDAMRAYVPPPVGEMATEPCTVGFNGERRVRGLGLAAENGASKLSKGIRKDTRQNDNDSFIVSLCGGVITLAERTSPSSSLEVAYK